MDLYTTNSASGDPIHDITPLNKPDDPNDLPLIGDWDGNGKDEVGIYHPTTRQLVLNQKNSSDSTSTVWLGGNWGDIPLVGSWNKALNGRDAIAYYRPENDTVYYPTTSDALRTDGEVKLAGAPGDVPIVGDWDGDGVDTLGLFRPAGSSNGGGLLYVKNSNTAGWPYTATVQNLGAQPGDKPIVGDWNLDGKDTIGLFRPSAYSAPTFFMSSPSNVVITPGVQYGNPGDVPTVGDWDGDKEHTFAVFRPDNHRFYMRAGNYSSPYGNVPGDFALTSFRMEATDRPLYGDWDGNGTDTPGYYRPSTRELFYGNSTKAPTLNSFGPIGDPGDIPVIGRWSNNTWRDMPALFRPSTDTLYYPSGSTPALNDSYAVHHTPGDTIMAADWDSDAIDTLGIWRPSNRTLYIRNVNQSVSWQNVGTVGNPGDLPLAGHFRKGYATDTFALFRPSNTMYNVFYGANATANFGSGIPFGSPGDTPAVGDWDGDALDTLGVIHTQRPAYGGPNGIVDFPGEADEINAAYRNAASDHIAASQVVADLWPSEVNYIDQRLRDTFPNGGVLRAAGLGENWWVKDGVRHFLANAPAADMVGADLGTTWRVSMGARDKFPAGETIDTTNATSWRYGGANGRVDTPAEGDAVVGVLMASEQTRADALYAALVAADREFVLQRYDLLADTSDIAENEDLETTFSVSWDSPYEPEGVELAQPNILPALPIAAAMYCIRWCDDAAKVGNKLVKVSRASKIPQRIPNAAEQAKANAFQALRGSNASSSLGRNLTKANRGVRSSGKDAAHIVAHSHKLAAPARAILQRCGIHPNSAKNGAWVDRGIHRRSHTTAYFWNVNTILTSLGALCLAQTPDVFNRDKAKVEKALEVIGDLLAKGKFPM